MIRRDVRIALGIAAVFVLALSASTWATSQAGGGVERGVLPARWTPEDPDCGRAPHFLVHEYNQTFVILRQSGCTNFEKPFLYLLFGSKQALLVDTGAAGVHITDAANRDIVHVLGAHIENARTPYVDYPQGTRFQPDEHSLELGRAHLLELQDALRAMGTPLRRRLLRDFTVWPRESEK